MKIMFNDGGQSEWLKLNPKVKITGGCVARALAIALEIPFEEARNIITEEAKFERLGKRSLPTDVNKGVKSSTCRRIAKKYKWRWTALKMFGQPTKYHLKQSELPQKGTYILRLSKHWTVLKDGVLHDCYDPSRLGTRTVYGYWKIPNKKK